MATPDQKTCCAHSRWGRKVAGVPRDRGEPLGTHFRRGSRNAGREAGAAKEEGPLECGQGGWGRTRGGVPWNAGRGAVALTIVVGQKSPIRISNLERRPVSRH